MSASRRTTTPATQRDARAALLLAALLGSAGATALTAQEREIVGLTLRGDEIELRSSGTIGSVTAAPIEQERTVILVLGHRPSPQLEELEPLEGALVRAVDLRTETSGSTIFTKVLIETSEPATASIETQGDTATIRMTPTAAPIVLPPTDDYVAEDGEADAVSATGDRIRTVAPVYLRDGPGQRFSAVRVVDANQPGEVLGAEDEWRWIQLDAGPQGWLHQDFVAVDPGAGSTATSRLEVPAEVGSAPAPTAAAPPPRRPPSDADATSGRIEQRVRSLLEAFEAERADLAGELAGAEKELDGLRRENYRLEEQLRGAESARAAAVRDARRLAREATETEDQLDALQRDLDSRNVELLAQKSDFERRERRAARLVEAAEADLGLEPPSSGDLVERLTRVLAVYEARNRQAPTPAAEPAGTTSEPTPSRPEPPVVHPGEAGDIRETVALWAAAWAAQDVDGYLAHYSDRFRPPGGTTRSEWRERREGRVQAPESISVTVTDLQIDELSPVEARARFVQDYRSDRFADRVRKRLELELEGATWRIVREVALPSE